jgi:hypothetical protein
VCVVARDLIVYGVLNDMMKGRPAIYSTFSSYDEVAHHSGLEREDTLEALRKLDQQFGRIERARRYAARPYELVVLSDHGQTQGATFKQRNGYGLDELVQRTSPRRRHALAGGDEQDAMVGHAAAEATGRKQKRAKNDVSGRDVVVLGSGNLGLVYLMEERARLTLEEIDARHPQLLPALQRAPARWLGARQVGASTAPVVLGGRGARYLDEDRVDGEDPLALFSPGRSAHLLRTDGFEHAPDVLLGSFYDPALDEGMRVRGADLVPRRSRRARRRVRSSSIRRSCRRRTSVWSGAEALHTCADGLGAAARGRRRHAAAGGGAGARAPSDDRLAWPAIGQRSSSWARPARPRRRAPDQTRCLRLVHEAERLASGAETGRRRLQRLVAERGHLGGGADEGRLARSLRRASRRDDGAVRPRRTPRARCRCCSTAASLARSWSARRAPSPHAASLRPALPPRRRRADVPRCAAFGRRSARSRGSSRRSRSYRSSSRPRENELARRPGERHRRLHPGLERGGEPARGARRAAQPSPEADVLVVDGQGSTDRTARSLRRAPGRGGSRSATTRACASESPPGYAWALENGLTPSAGASIADGSASPERARADSSTVVRSGDCDVAVGSRVRDRETATRRDRYQAEPRRAFRHRPAPAARSRLVLRRPLPIRRAASTPSTRTALPLLAQAVHSRAPEVEGLDPVRRGGAAPRGGSREHGRRAGGESKLRGGKAVKLVLTVVGTLGLALLARRSRKGGVSDASTRSRRAARSSK